MIQGVRAVAPGAGYSAGPSTQFGGSVNEHKRPNARDDLRRWKVPRQDTTALRAVVKWGRRVQRAHLSAEAVAGLRALRGLPTALTAGYRSGLTRFAQCESGVRLALGAVIIVVANCLVNRSSHRFEAATRKSATEDRNSDHRRARPVVVCRLWPTSVEAAIGSPADSTAAQSSRASAARGLDL